VKGREGKERKGKGREGKGREGKGRAVCEMKEEEEKESHVQVLSMKKIDLTLLDIMNHIAS
jgi:hypothetical protein